MIHIPPAQIQQSPRTILLASWYAHGLPDPEAMVCASNAHPRGTRLRLRLSPAHPWVKVKVIDYGPDPKHPEAIGRTLDVSLGVARKLGMVKKGLAFVEVEVIK
jgi:rare lipoprotein A (peptidoglycan hydrolase)